MWTKERMQSLLSTNDLAVERALVVIYDRQTHDEKRDSETKHHNARGFRKNHDHTGSRLACYILKGWKQTNGKKRLHLNQVNLGKAREIVLHYHKQLCEVANEKETSKKETPLPGPQPGTYAYTARILAQSGLMTGDEADRWKDEMKDAMVD
jgi:hypothetical protein